MSVATCAIVLSTVAAMRLSSVVGTFSSPTSPVDVDETAGCSKLCPRLISWEKDALWLSAIVSTPCTRFYASSKVKPIRWFSSAMLVVTRSQFKFFSHQTLQFLNRYTSFNPPLSWRFNSLVACVHPWRELSTLALRASATSRYSKADAVACSKGDCISTLFESDWDLWSCTSLFTPFYKSPNASTCAVKADPPASTPRAWSSSSRC